MTRFASLVFVVALGFVSLTATAQEKGETTENLSRVERLPAKIQKIQTKLPAWMKKTGNKKVLALMQKMREQIEAENLEEADKTADSIQKIMGSSVPKVGSTDGKKSERPTFTAAEDTTKRLTEKVERVKAGAQQWAASGHDPAEIIKTMQEKFQPLMQAGKVVEAEAVLDSVLKRLGMDAGAPAAAAANEPSDEERVLTRIHMIQKELPAWIKKTGKQAESDSMMQKLKELLADMNFAEAVKTADEILEMMGLSIAPAAQTERTATANAGKNDADPHALFLPYQLVFLASDRIALTSQQRDALLAQVKTTQPRLEELKTVLEHEFGALAALTSKERADEAAVLAQLNKFLDVEREIKQLQVRQGVSIQNVLTSEQHAKLRELTRNQDVVTKLEEEVSQRIAAKVERIMAGAQKWAESGRDVSVIAKAMDEKVRPLMETGRIFEAETELDRVLGQLNEDSK